MANVSSIDVGVLLLIAVTAFLANGSSSSSSADESHRREAQAAKLKAALGGISAPDQRSPRPRGAGEACPECDQSAPRRRAKRCTCYSYKDKECVYYCHLDIIWINTPEHTVPYGMSSYRGSQRLRRAARTEGGRRGADDPPRCACSLGSDTECSRFCVERQRTPQPTLD